MGRLDYRKEKFEPVCVCGVVCSFNDMRIDRDTVPEGKYFYEVAGDDDAGGGPTRVQRRVLVNFSGPLVSDSPLPIGEDGTLWLEEGDFIWL